MSNHANVSYKPIRGLPPNEFRAGDDGSIWKHKFGKWKQLKPTSFTSRGRPTLYVRMIVDGKLKRFNVAALVLMAFGRHQMIGEQPVHLDDDPFNNRAVNLRWGPRGSARIGRPNPVFRGVTNPNAKMTEANVVEARRLYHVEQWSIKDVADLFGMSLNATSCLLSGKTWSQVPGAHVLRASGHNSHGTSHPRATTSVQEVHEIRRLHREGMKKAKIAQKLDVSQHVVQDILRNRTWKNV